MDIKHKEIHGSGSFYIEKQGQVVGQAMYSRMDAHNITIHHTEVNESLKGKGAGKQLIAQAVDWARQNQILIHPTCSFARSLFEKIEEFSDVWKKDR